MTVLTTPALLFPAISLLLLAYTNRFLVLAQLVRQLVREDQDITPDDKRHTAYLRQLSTLQQRIRCIKYMQALGIISFIACTASMLALMLEHQFWGDLLLVASLVILVISLLFALYEVLVSTEALSVELNSHQNGR